MADTNKKGQSLGTLFADLSDKTTSLIRQEITLAKQEVTEKLKRAIKDVVFLCHRCVHRLHRPFSADCRRRPGAFSDIARLGGDINCRCGGAARGRPLGVGGGQQSKKYQPQTGANH